MTRGHARKPNARAAGGAGVTVAVLLLLLPGCVGSEPGECPLPLYIAKVKNGSVTEFHVSVAAPDGLVVDLAHYVLLHANGTSERGRLLDVVDAPASARVSFVNEGGASYVDAGDKIAVRTEDSVELEIRDEEDALHGRTPACRL